MSKTPEDSPPSPLTVSLLGIAFERLASEFAKTDQQAALKGIRSVKQFVDSELRTMGYDGQSWGQANQNVDNELTGPTAALNGIFKQAETAITKHSGKS